MTIVKVATVEDSYIGLVTDCKEAAGKFGPQVLFEFDGGDQLYLPAQSAVNQLLRCGFDDGGDPPRAAYEQVPGHTLVFTRTPNKTKGASPYWNVEIASGADQKPKAPKMTQEHVAKALDLHPHPAKPTYGGTGKTFDDLVQTYKAVWAIVSAAQGAGATAESVNAGVATLMIHADKHGIPLPAKLERLTSAKAARPQPDADPADDLPF